jgi:hypothetical protein
MKMGKSGGLTGLTKLTELGHRWHRFHGSYKEARRRGRQEGSRFSFMDSFILGFLITPDPGSGFVNEDGSGLVSGVFCD